MGMASNAEILRIYYSCPEIGNKELMTILGCGLPMAQKRKGEIRKVMQAKGVKTAYTQNVNTEIALEFLGINIINVESKYIRMQKLEFNDLRRRSPHDLDKHPDGSTAEEKC